jgi:hypothetical protein
VPINISLLSDSSGVSNPDVLVVDSTFDEDNILCVLCVLLCLTAKITNYSRPGRALSRAKLLELQGLLANFDTPPRHPEPLTETESEDSAAQRDNQEGQPNDSGEDDSDSTEEDGQVETRVQSKAMCVYSIYLTPN